MVSWFYDKLENTVGISCKTIITIILNAFVIEKELVSMMMFGSFDFS